MKFLIYSGPGVGERSRCEAERALAVAVPAAELCPIGPEEVCAGKWPAKSVLLVMPGGRDLPYCEHLNGAGTRAIRNFVLDGGTYLGFCAGAYFACAEIEFERGTQNEVYGLRELAFFPGLGVGSALGPGTYSYRDNESARLTTVMTETIGAVPVYYDGGCTFIGDFPNVTVLARYADIADSPAAIVSCKVGRGRAILSGVHPEFGSQQGRMGRGDIDTGLEQSEEQRRALLRSMLFKFGSLSGAPRP